MFQTNRAGEALFAVSRALARASARTQSPCTDSDRDFGRALYALRKCARVRTQPTTTHLLTRDLLPTHDRVHALRRAHVRVHARSRIKTSVEHKRGLSPQSGPRERARALWNAQRAHTQQRREGRG